MNKVIGLLLAAGALLIPSAPVTASGVESVELMAGPTSADRHIGRGAWVIETFDGTLDDAWWRSGPTDAIVPDGGNADAFLHPGTLVSEAPSITNLGFSPFVGPYRQMGVVDLGIDVQVLSASPLEGDRPVSVELTYNSGTPEDPTDDCVVVQAGKRLTPALSGWQAYNFKAPAWMTRLPTGWRVASACGLTEDEVWNRIMQHVSRARFLLGDPGLSYPSQEWQVGFDNPRIRIGGKGDAG